MKAVGIDQQTDPSRWAEMVQGLCRAPDWAGDELPIEVTQTHISAVLLGRRHVLKLKKPVDFGFLDYTTPEKRRRACEAEVRLNRRLCPDVYLGVRPISEVEGKPRLLAAGRVVDYGVWMKRLPADRMLDQMVKRNAVTEAVIDRVAGRLSAFHKTARRGPDVDAYGSPAAIRGNWEENFRQTAPYVGRTITAPAFDTIRRWVTNWLDSSAASLRSRVRDGWVCDGHGDVRCESVCVTDEVCFFDCIEFNERFRCGDVAGEAAFLAMDLDARGRPDLGYYFSERYQARTADEQLFALLPFYRCYRAYVRGKVLSFRLDEPEFGAEEKEAAMSRARHYFELARRYASPLARPTVIVVAGLSGTGKTSVARAVAGELGLRVVSADAVRQSLFGEAKRPAGYGRGAYTAEANRRTYEALVETGHDLLGRDGGVILDATFRRAADRELARAMAARARAQWRLIECQLAPELVEARLNERLARRDGLSDAAWETCLRQREEFEPVADSSAFTHLVLDTSADLRAGGHAATDWLRGNDRRGDQATPLTLSENREGEA